MQKWIILPILMVMLSAAHPALAQTASQAAENAVLTDPTTSTPTEADIILIETATDSAVATPAATVAEKIEEKKAQDITEPTGREKSKLAQYLEQNPPGPLSWNNFLQHAVANAVAKGVPANILVLVILFPLIASLIAASRHVIGLRGFGIYIPAVLSVALVSTGILAGLLIFSAISGAALLSKKPLRKLKVSYLPRTAILLWTISVGLLSLMLAAPYLNLVNLMSVNIFPILILVLLAENFMDALGRTKPADALSLTFETLGLAFLSSMVLQWQTLQRWALVEPELLLTLILILNIAIGKFTGLRLSEFLRFRSLIEEE
jgi:hypothetical protein